MAPKKRKISDLSPDDTTSLLRTLDEFRDALHEDDEDVPAGLIATLDTFRHKLETVKHTSFSKVDPMTLLSVNIKSGPLFLQANKRSSVETAGSTEVLGNVLSMPVLRSIIELIRGHVSAVSEAGCRVSINMILLRVSEVLSSDGFSVNIIPEFPISKTEFPGSRSFGGVVDFVMTKLPERYTRYLLGDPTTALANPDEIKGPVTSNIFEAKRDNVRAAVPQAVMATASHCRQHGIEVLRGCITSGEQWIFFIYSATANGGHVSCSDEFTLGSTFEGLPLILGILRDWVNDAYCLQSDVFTVD